VTSGGNNFNDFPDNQLTKFRVFIGWSQSFTPCPKFMWRIKVRHPHRMDAPDRHNGQRDTRTNVRTNGRTEWWTKRRVSVRPSVS